MKLFAICKTTEVTLFQISSQVSRLMQQIAMITSIFDLLFY